eukprot:CAMPEP_0180339020 /NCGR_PEP_ID=MMETSP0988-20121125/46242_1 /TAXON_ID=697907 /ORGANISM="non described non described, Strain CCMP2293" /LENGTH=57 /DNA_ID=CAMNT_0022327503 /DNA_START=130 /DNA_END=299 /DNA_ORIENTATION=-
MRLHHEDGPSFAPDGRVSPAQPGPESHPGLNSPETRAVLEPFRDAKWSLVILVVLLA